MWGRRRSDGAPEPVALTSGVKVCDFSNSSVADCNGNTWPGYRDASYTSVQPIRSSRSPGGILKTEDGDAARTCHAALGELCWAKAYGRQSGCTICAGRAQAALRRAGCSNEAITGWCAKPSVRLDVYNSTDGKFTRFQSWSYGGVDVARRTGQQGPFAIRVPCNSSAGLQIHGPLVLELGDLDTLELLASGLRADASLVLLDGLRDPIGSPVSLRETGGVLGAQERRFSVPFTAFQGHLDAHVHMFQLHCSPGPQVQFGGFIDLTSIAVIGWPRPPSGAFSVAVTKRAEPVAISRDVFGVNFARDAQLDRSYPVNRWGGNAVGTRYAWDIDTTNRANDWFFESLPEQPAPAHPELLPANSTAERFLDATLQNPAVTDPSALFTIPAIGWSPAERAPRCGFSVTKYGPQDGTDKQRPDCGTGVRDGRDIVADPTDTSRRVGPEYVGGWLGRLAQTRPQAVSTQPERAHPSPRIVIAIDNEPDLWHATHRDVHPERVTPDELWNVSLLWAAEAKRVLPEVQVAAPVLSGWCAMTSCNDGTTKGPAGEGLLAWFAKQVAGHEQATGERLVDLLDNHFYPSATGVGSDADDLLTRILRLRSPASLVESGYVDESWIEKRLAFLPRMKQIISDSGASWLKIAVSEHAWGDDFLLSTAVAEAEALATFATEGVQMATRWEAPKLASATEAAYGLLLGYFCDSCGDPCGDVPCGPWGRPAGPRFAPFAGVAADASVVSTGSTSSSTSIVRAFAAVDVTAAKIQVLLLCKYPVPGVRCEVSLTVSPRDFGLDCTSPSASLRSIGPVETWASCGPHAAQFCSMSNKTVAVERQLTGALVVRPGDLPALSATIVEISC